MWRAPIPYLYMTNPLRNFYATHPRLSLSLALLFVALAGFALWYIALRDRSDGLPPAETPADTGALRVSLLPTAECFPFYVAEATGVYDSLGLSVTITNRTAQFDADTALYGTAAHLAATDLVRVQYQSARGNKASVVMGLPGAWGLSVAPGKRVGNVKGLKDRLLGVARYSASDYFGAQVLHAADMGYDDMLRAQTNNFSVRASMVCLAQTEAAVLPEPWLAWAEWQQAKTLCRSSQSDAAMGCLAAHSNVLTSKRRCAQAALLVKGYNIAAARLDRNGLRGCDTLIATRFAIPLEVLSKARLPRYRRAALPPAASITASRTFLTSRGVALSGTFMMDDRLLK